MPRIPKLVALDLIMYAKKIDIKCNYWHPKATSAIEFFRQMSSSQLRKRNPIFEVKIFDLPENETPHLIADFIDGSKWETETAAYSATELRDLFYGHAARIEDVYDEAGESFEANEPGSSGSKGSEKGGKGGKK